MSSDFDSMRQLTQSGWLHSGKTKMTFCVYIIVYVYIFNSIVYNVYIYISYYIIMICALVLIPAGGLPRFSQSPQGSALKRWNSKPHSPGRGACFFAFALVWERVSQGGTYNSHHLNHQARSILHVMHRCKSKLFEVGSPSSVIVIVIHQLRLCNQHEGLSVNLHSP